MKNIDESKAIIDVLIASGALKSEKQLLRMGIDKLQDICIKNDVCVFDILCYYCLKDHNKFECDKLCKGMLEKI